MMYRFKEELTDKLEEVFVKEHGGIVDFITTQKVNCSVEQITLRLAGSPMGPSFTIKSLYDEYEGGLSIDDIAARLVEKALEPTLGIDMFTKEFTLKNASMRLLNAEKNQHLIEGHFTESFLDLLMVYSVDFEDGEGHCSFLVTKGFAHANEITFEELREAARKNMGQPSINTLPEILGMPEEICCEGPEGIMRIVGRNKRFGASYLAFVSEWASSIQEIYGCDQFVILPSSVEELIVVPYDKEDAESQLFGLMAMVSSVNEEVLEQDEFLSDSIYLWDGEVIFKVDERIARSIIAG